MLWKKQNINKRLQCKAKTHISERSYFYKKTVPVSLFSLCGLLPVPKYRNEAETLKKKTLKKGVFVCSFGCFCTLELCTPKSPKCRVEFGD